MKLSRTPLAASLFAAASFTALESTSHAQAYNEVGDAGQTLLTAQGTASNAASAGVPLTTIGGTLSTFTDADLFVINITNVATFSATATSAAGIDTSLFLFTASGVPVYANDDQSNINYQASLPTGNTLLTSLSPGTYFLGISLSGNEAVNLNNQLLFTTDQPTTNVRGIASGLNPTTLSTFNGATFVQEAGTYSLALTGAATAVPEPSTWAALALGSMAAAFTFLRRRSSRV